MCSGYKKIFPGKCNAAFSGPGPAFYAKRSNRVISEEAATMGRPKIKHLAIMSRNPDKLAKFY